MANGVETGMLKGLELEQTGGKNWDLQSFSELMDLCTLVATIRGKNYVMVWGKSEDAVPFQLGQFEWQKGSMGSRNIQVFVEAVLAVADERKVRKCQVTVASLDLRF